MSNIPPEPPDPPIPPASLTSYNPNASRTTNRRSKGRGQYRNVGGDADRTHATSSGALPSTADRGECRRRKSNFTGLSDNIGSGHTPSDDVPTAGAYSKSLASTPRSSRRKNRKPDEEHAGHVQAATEPGPVPRTRGPSRRSQFGSQLTEHGAAHLHVSSRRPRSPPPDSENSLTTSLILALRKAPYPDCPICFNCLHPAQPTWSCSLSEEATSCCWATFHLKCVREWARKSTKEVRNALVARGEANEGEYWRCPGCQTKRTQVPQSYLCFCGTVTDPKPGLATPHSCGMPCSRRRISCEHPCPLSCHPGPCPPCVLTVHPSCHCTKTTLAIRCAHFHTVPAPSLSCGQLCGRPLSCGNHRCEKQCHPGECGACERREAIKCYCGMNLKTVDCGEGKALWQESCLIGPDGNRTIWDGRFDCGNQCGRSFTCGLHVCSKTCHPPSSTPGQCPFHPSAVTHCPCGKHLLQEICCETRTKCTDPVPTCASSCGKQLETCSHRCLAQCHVGVCPPCTIPVTIPCRCGSTSRDVPCQERQHDIAQGREVVVCDKVCGVLRLCGRHQCSRVCCPLAGTMRGKGGKGKKVRVGLQQALLDVELDDAERLWHQCDLACGKMLGCGLHRCAEPDHRGPCSPCLQSSFNELSCHCERTIVSPPVPCGTQINCTYPCDRLLPDCGHGRTPHSCHEDPVPCPPCPFLTTKPCACGKSNLSNVRCSQEKVSCGQSCGRLLGCGFHRCQKVCHAGDCGGCSSVCGKPRKLCLPAHHPCALSCHAPSACNESEACSAMITVSCPCGRFQQPTKCGRCTFNPNKALQPLQCRDDCGIAQRNARLAEALGISPETKEKTNVTYPEDLVAYGMANAKFVDLVEKTLDNFVVSDKKTQVLPYMPEARRTFVRELSQLYRIDTQLVDQEPRRSIQLYRRIDTRTPSPALTSFLAARNPTPSLGKLVDLRTAPAPRPATGVTRSSSAMASNRGWRSIVSSTQQVATLPSAITGSSGTSHTSPVWVAARPRASGNSTNVRENWESD